MIVRLRLELNVPADNFHITVRLDQRCVFDRRGGGDIMIPLWFDDAAGPHELDLYLSGKTFDDTKIDHQGEVASDRSVSIHKVWIDDVDITRVFFDLARYHHDNNGQQDPQEDNVYHVLGYNGHVRFVFESPVYRWLLKQC